MATFYKWLFTVSSYGKGLKQLLVYPTNDISLSFVESIGLCIQNQGAVEMIPYDVTLKIFRGLNSDSSAALKVARYVGAGYVLVGGIDREKGFVQFNGVLHETEGESWEISESGAEDCLVLGAVVQKVAEHLGIPSANEGLPCMMSRPAEDFYNLGLLNKNRGNFIQAISLFQSALGEQPEHFMARIRLAQCRLVSGEILEVEPILVTLSQHDSLLIRLWRLELICRAAVYQGKLELAESSLDQAIKLAVDYQLMRHKAILLNLKVNFLQVTRHDLEAAVILASEVSGIYEDLGDYKGVAESKFILAQIMMSYRKDWAYKKAEALIKSGKRQLKGLGYMQHEASALYLEALNRIYQGVNSESEILDRLTRAEGIFLEIGSLYSYINTGAERCNYYLGVGRYDEAQNLLNTLLEHARKNGFFKFEIMLRNLKASIYFKKGELLEAASELLGNIRSLETRPISYLKENSYNKLIPIFLSLGYYDRALKASSNLLLLVDHDSYDRERYSFLLNNHGEILFLLGKLAEATTYFEESIDLKRKFGNAASMAWTLRNMISVKIQLGAFSEAEKLLLELEAMDPNKLGNCVLEAQLKNKQGHVKDAYEVMTAAKSRFPNQWSEGFEGIYRTLGEILASGQKGEVGLLLPNHL